MKGKPAVQFSPLEIARNARQARRAATIGGSAGLIDKAYRHDDLSKNAYVAQNPNSPFTSPKQELFNTGETGKFEASKIHNFGKAPKSATIGNKFKLP